MPATLVAIAACTFTAFPALSADHCDRAAFQSALGRSMGTIGWIIFVGLTHFNAKQAFDFPPGAFTLSRDFSWAGRCHADRSL